MMITIKDLSKEFKSNNNGPLKVLDKVSFQVKEGEFISIVGPSGCGKSTLLRIIGGLDEETSGMIEHDNGKPNISFIFQNHGLLEWRTLKKNVELPAEIMGFSDRFDSTQMLDMVGLQGFEDFLPSEVSGGMKQKASLARALSFDPDLMLMDEPFAAVDMLSRETLGLEVKRILNNKTVLFTTHNLEEAVFLSDKVVIMSKRPARIKEIIKIELPRDRELEIKYTEKFQRYVKWIKESFRE